MKGYVKMIKFIRFLVTPKLSNFIIFSIIPLLIIGGGLFIQSNLIESKLQEIEDLMDLNTKQLTTIIQKNDITLIGMNLKEDKDTIYFLNKETLYVYEIKKSNIKSISWETLDTIDENYYDRIFEFYYDDIITNTNNNIKSQIFLIVSMYFLGFILYGTLQKYHH